MAIQIDLRFTEAQFEEFERIAHERGRTLKEHMIGAISLMRFVQKEQRAGSQLLMLVRDNEGEVIDLKELKIDI